MVRLRGAVKQAVRAAVRSGKLQPVEELACKDCGAPAIEYDHRDYGKPLEVEPVCRKCNLRRGSATGFGWRGELAKKQRAQASLK